MKQAAQMINHSELRKFAPLTKLSDEDAQELLRTSITVQVSPGTPVFTQDDMDKQVFYLLKGKVEVRGNNKKTVITAGSKEAYSPMGRHLPGQVSAQAIEESVLISFDADMLDLFLNWTNPNAYVVNEMETSKDHEWMNRLLQSRGLLRFSEAQINTLLDRMNEVHFKAGDTVVAQDGDDDFYYVIKQGAAAVYRQPDVDAKPIKLAELRAGDAFGEESLLTSANRGATVQMQEDGALMRLSKQDFSELLAQPLLSTINWEEAQAMAATGGLFIDIRLQEEHRAMSIPGSVNIPLPVLRLKLKNLKQNRKYIIYCDDGSRSSVAAFLLNRHGFDAFILDGGLTSALPHLAAAHSAAEQLDEAESATTGETAADHPDNPPEAEATVNHTKQGNAYCSLADYWGSTVDEVGDDSFADSQAVYQVEKTKSVGAPVKPIIIDKIKQASPEAKAPLKAAVGKPACKPAPKAESAPAVRHEHNEGHLLRNTLLGIAVLAGAALLALNHFSPGTLSVTAEPASVAAPAPATQANNTAPGLVTEGQPPREMLPPQATEPATATTPQAADTYVTLDGEVLQLQAQIIGAEAAASAAPEMSEFESTGFASSGFGSAASKTPEPVALDPATRGFIE